ncbi:uncharacterized protein V6R79_023950 [Siganus canaliculatus]
MLADWLWVSGSSSDPCADSGDGYLYGIPLPDLLSFISDDPLTACFIVDTRYKTKTPVRKKKALENGIECLSFSLDTMKPEETTLRLEGGQMTCAGGLQPSGQSVGLEESGLALRRREVGTCASENGDWKSRESGRVGQWAGRNYCIVQMGGENSRRLDGAYILLRYHPSKADVIFGLKYMILTFTIHCKGRVHVCATDVSGTLIHQL